MSRALSKALYRALNRTLCRALSGALYRALSRALCKAFTELYMELLQSFYKTPYRSPPKLYFAELSQNSTQRAGGVGVSIQRWCLLHKYRGRIKAFTIMNFFLALYRYKELKIL